jgi:ribonuclease E
LKEAVADLAVAPPPVVHAPVQAEAPRPSAPPAEPESPRRRSTIRERAPVSGSGESALPPAPMPPAVPTPEPVIADLNATETTDRPRKTGWWSRRFAGG